MNTYVDFDKILKSIIDFSPKLIGAIAVLVIGNWLRKLIMKNIEKILFRKKTDPGLTSFTTSTLDTLIKVTILLIAVSIIGVELTFLTVVFGAMAFAVGMALQGNLSHFASGIMILAFKPFTIGDFIKTQGYSGTVKDIKIFSTVLVTLDNRVVIVPNGTIASNILENLTANKERVVAMSFGISYNDDIDKARKVIIDVAKGCPKIIQDKPVAIMVEALADSSVNLTVRPWAKSVDYWEVYFYMHEHVKKAFDKDNVSIPFPQMDVHFDKEA